MLFYDQDNMKTSVSKVGSYFYAFIQKKLSQKYSSCCEYTCKPNQWLLQIIPVKAINIQDKSSTNTRL